MKKNRKNGTLDATPQTKSRPAGSSAKVWALAALCLAAAGGTWAFCEYVVWNTLPAELVGKWEVIEGEQTGSIFDFYRSGKLIGHLNVGEDLRILKASVRVEDDKIYFTTRNPQNGQELTTVQTIRKLAPREFVIVDYQGKQTVMKRPGPGS